MHLLIARVLIFRKAEFGAILLVVIIPRAINGARFPDAFAIARVSTGRATLAIRDNMIVLYDCIDVLCIHGDARTVQIPRTHDI